MQTLEEYLEDQIEWSKRVFGEGKRTEGILKHIAKESKEVRDDPEDLMEWIDIIILGLDGAWRAGFQPEEIVLALVEKQEINFNRKWKVGSENEAVEHIKEEGAK